MSDEICVQSNGSIKVLNACEDGYPISAYRFLQEEGVVTGGKYRQKPYTFYPCGKHKDDPFYGPCPKELWHSEMSKEMSA
ncbi:hypothetical protein ANCDUO_27243 [Ancylostoma duodenale]|uniref:Uncharacterized protein n=1 Tax=Ancylostoma duodenale TaxID=51022 RepID=A0A0C2BG98_9BILA|nr:hypothetical protein ANCDUO_27243 [Ancylostoma duodenale]